MLLDGLLGGIHNKKQKGYCISQLALEYRGYGLIWKMYENVWTCLDYSICSLRQHNFHPCLHMCVQDTFGWTFAWLFLSPSSNPWSVTTQRFQSALIQEILWSCPNLYPTSIGGYTPLSNPFKNQQSLWVSSICKSEDFVAYFNICHKTLLKYTIYLWCIYIYTPCIIHQKYINWLYVCM